MDAQGEAALRPHEELGPVDTSVSHDVLPVEVREAVDGDARAIGTHEEEIAPLRSPAVQLLPESQRGHDLGAVGRRPGVVGLVLVERDDASIEVDVGDREPRRLVGAEAEAREGPEEHPPVHLVLRASERLRLLVGVEQPLRLVVRHPRQPARGERARLDDAGGVRGQLEHAVQHLRVLTSTTGLELARRRLLTRERALPADLVEPAHCLVGVVQRERDERDVAHDVVEHVEPVLVVRRALLRGNVVGEVVVELAVRPALREPREGDGRLRIGQRIDDLESASGESADRLRDLRERRFVRRFGAEVDDLRDEVAAARLPKAVHPGLHHAAARLDFVEAGRPRRQPRDAVTRAVRHPHEGLAADDRSAALALTDLRRHG
ncbi:MAG TPA: hypothetical protein VGL81_36395 [Polyangiaceae bacterium]